MFSLMDTSVYSRLQLLIDFIYKILYKNERISDVSIWRSTERKSIARFANGTDLPTLPCMILLCYILTNSFTGNTDICVSSSILRALLARLIDPLNNSGKERGISLSNRNSDDDDKQRITLMKDVGSISAAELMGNAANRRGLHLPRGAY